MLIARKVTFVFWVLLSVYFSIESWRLGLGNVNAPGPGFFPFWVSLVVGVLAVVLFLHERRKELVRHVSPLFKGKNLGNVIYAYVFLFGYVGLFHEIGFLLCSVLFTGLCLKVLGAKKWNIVVWFSISVAVFSYVVFDHWLGIPFPKGKWTEGFLSVGEHLWK